MADTTKNTKTESKDIKAKTDGGIKPETETKERDVASVSLSKAEFDALMAKIDTLQRKVEYVSDKDRSDRFEAKEKSSKTIFPTAGISSIDGKKIIGWRTIANEAEWRNGVYFENQIIEVAYQDQTFQKMEYREFSRNKVKNVGEIVGKAFDGETGKEVLTIKMPDGEKINIGIEFIN